MNILVVCDSSLYFDFGTSFVHAQAAAYVALGHRVRVIVPYAVGKKDWDGNRFSGAIHRWDQDGVEIYAIRHLSLSNYGKAYFNLASALRTLPKRLDKLLDGFVPDMIHAHALGFDSEIGAWLKGRLGVPLVVTTHGSDTAVPFQEGRLQKLRDYSNRADCIVAVSSALANKLRFCGTETSVSVILNGFRIKNLMEEVCERGCTLLQVGRLEEQKRPHITIRAFAQLQAKRPESVLTLIGSGTHRTSLESLCRELGVSENVHFLGETPNQKTLETMVKTRFFVMPSVDEGFGIVYLEAMASGCITIGTEGEGIADLIVSSENGFLVPPDCPEAITEVIEWCLDHPEAANMIAERGRQDAMNLTWKHNAEQYIELFGRIQRDGT